MTVRATRSGGQDVRAPSFTSDHFVRDLMMLFVSLCLCGKCLSHETTTTAFVSADFAARSFHLCFSPIDRRANRNTGPEKTGAEKTDVNALRA